MSSAVQQDNEQTNQRRVITGTATPDPANPGFFYNSKYKIAITSGTGAYASARGLAEIEEVVMFTSQATATATWNMKGFVLLPR